MAICIPKQYRWSDEARARVSAAMKGNTRGAGAKRPKTPEMRARISATLTGRKYPERQGAGHALWKGGKALCVECGTELTVCKNATNRPVPKRCWPCHVQHRVGGNNPNWRGDKPQSGYPGSFNARLKRSIRERDGYVCAICNITEADHQAKTGRVLSVNHIDWDRHNNHPRNLNTLCIGCNNTVNTDKAFWSRHFALQAEWEVLQGGMLP